jgi:hypothetical protein
MSCGGACVRGEGFGGFLGLREKTFLLNTKTAGGSHTPGRPSFFQIVTG